MPCLTDQGQSARLRGAIGAALGLEEHLRLEEELPRRLVGVQTYGSNYIVFLPPGTGGGDLSFSLRFLDEYPCMRCLGDPEEPYSIQTRAATYEGQVMLAVDLIGYDLTFPPGTLDPRTNGLDGHGDRMRVIETHWVEPAPNQVVDFNRSGFGTGNNDAVAVVLSLVLKEGGTGNFSNRMVPFEYRFQTLPASVSNLPSTISGGDCHYIVAAGETAWVQGEVRILPGCDLTVDEGAKVYFRGADARITADGGSLIVRGSAEAPVEFLPSILPGDTNTNYAGLFAENLGLIDLQHCRLNDAVQIAADSALVRIANTVIYMAENNDNAIVLDLQNAPGDPAFSACEISNINRIWLGSGTGKSAEVSGCTLTQREDFQSLLSLPPPLIYCIKGNLSVSESQLRFLRRGIQVGEKYMPHQPVATLGPGLDIAPHPLATAPEAGIVCRGVAEVDIRGCDVFSNFPVQLPAGVKVWDGAQLRVDESRVIGCDYGLINYAWTGAVDLGSAGGSEGQNFIAPSLNLADCWRYISGPLPDCELDATQVDMVRVYNATTTVIPAAGNAWGTCEDAGSDYGIDCMCEEAFFPPHPDRVGFSPWLPSALMACSLHPGTPGFFLGAAAPLQEAAPEGAWPNPFNGRIHFRYRAHGQPAALEIFDILGRKLRDLEGRLLESGDREFIWEGDTNAGAALSSGVYLYRIVGQGHTLKGKVIYVK